MIWAKPLNLLTMRKIKVPDTFVIIFCVLLFCAALTWFLPGGEYVAGADGSRTFVESESVPQTWQVFSSVFEGFVQQAEIIIFVLIIGGAFWVVNSTKAVDTGILKFISRAQSLERKPFFKKIGVGNVVIVLIMLLFGLFGAVFGMSEETIAFVAIVIPLAISLGYDSITGVCMVYFAAHVGFAGAMLNPFTIGIAQKMSDLPLFSGMGYRTVCWVILMLIAISIVLIYAARVKRDPSRSPMYHEDEHWRRQAAEVASETEVETETKAGAKVGAKAGTKVGTETGEETSSVESEGRKGGSRLSAWVVFGLTAVAVLLFCIFYAADCHVKLGSSSIDAPLLLWIVFGLYLLSSLWSLRSSEKMFILNMLLSSILFLIVGVLGYGWYISEIAALFLALAIASGFAYGYDADTIVKQFMTGAKDIFSAALVIGVAAGIIVILKDGRVIDTILHSLAQGLDGTSRVGALSTMYGIQTFINLFIPSASAKAAITMPIMAPFSDLIGVSRQATVLAFQFGDGFTNMITPCSGVLLAVLSVARIPYTKWFSWVWKFILLLILVGFVLLLPTLFFNLAGF